MVFTSLDSAFAVRHVDGDLRFHDAAGEILRRERLGGIASRMAADPTSGQLAIGFENGRVEIRSIATGALSSSFNSEGGSAVASLLFDGYRATA